MEYFHSLNLTHGNIRPEFIGKDKADFNYLLMDDLSH